MIRAVLDPNVIISALLSPEGTPAAVLRGCLQGDFEAIVSPLLLAELERALAYPKLRRRVTSEEAHEVVELLATIARVIDDPNDAPPVRTSDPCDDYLIALAAASSAVLVSGDEHLLALSGKLPVFKASDFLAFLRQELRR
ncbi:MAG: putative toxin-antitoxin system toxin component, PIN family [Acidimicrobiia bacterium]